MSQPQTIVHLLRHGEVHNPQGILYGRRDGFHLSDLGKQMAQRVADTIAAALILLLFHWLYGQFGRANRRNR